jgi:hypothetical protein
MEFVGWVGMNIKQKTSLCDDVWRNIQSTDVRMSSVKKKKGSFMLYKAESAKKKKVSH